MANYQSKMHVTLLILFTGLISFGGGKNDDKSKNYTILGKSAGPESRKEGVHDGNRILTVFFNFGGIGEGQVSRVRSGIYPRGSGHSYFYDFSPIVGAEAENGDGEIFHIFSDGLTGESTWDPRPSGEPYRFEPEPGYANPDTNRIAMSDDKSTWPEFWPDKPEEWDGFWNGQYGKFERADQESYFVMNDFFNDEFDYYPVASDSSIRGLGFQVEVRGYQWAHPAAEDILIWTYWIENKADKKYEKVIFGMYGDADIGGTGDFGDDDANWNTDFDMVFQWDNDNRGSWGGPPAYFGFKFLESPGNPNDGIDNDNDGMIDESQFDGIDNDGDWDAEFDDIGSDGVGPNDQDYDGPDPDGTEGNGVPDVGEPNFEITDNDESDQIGLTSFLADEFPEIAANDDELLWIWTTPQDSASFRVTEQNKDQTFLYSSGYFPMDVNEKRKFAVAMLFGEDLNDIRRNALTMQKIYDVDYTFAKAPLKPMVIGVSGDGMVTLYWDDRAEGSIDPVYGKDFEGYRIYRSTDPAFIESWTVTDAYGNRTFNVPEVIYDKIDGLTGLHPIPFNGVHFEMGDDTGLTYSWIDSLVENGRTYYYAVTSYDFGWDLDFRDRGISTMEEPRGPIQPTESSKRIKISPTGVVIETDVNTVVVTPDAPSAGYTPPEVQIQHVEGISTAAIEVLDVLDPGRIDSSYYELIFDINESQKKLVTIYNVDEADTLYYFENTVLSDFANLIIGGEIHIGPYKISIKDVRVVSVDSSKWIEGREVLQHEAELAITPFPRDIEIRFFDEIADTSVFIDPKPVNFQVWNSSEEEKLNFIFADEDQNGMVTPGDKITALIGRATKTWDITFLSPLDSTAEADSTPDAGSILHLYVSKPLEPTDKFRIVGSKATIDQQMASNSLDKIAVVPNPYVVTANWEPQHFFTSGRGQRKIDFIHLPMEATITIVNTRGHHVVTLHHESSIDDGSYSWDMLSKDRLEIAYGVYIYHVSAPGVGEHIGKFAIIK